MKIKAFDSLREVKKFGKSGAHITLPKTLIGKKVVIIPTDQIKVPPDIVIQRGKEDYGAGE